MMGYYKDPERTAQAFDEDGWFRTGDIGKLYKDNRLCVTGRLKNIIILPNGKNVYPEELEYKLHRMSDLLGEIVVREFVRPNGEHVVGAEIYPDQKYIKENNITDVNAAVKEILDRYNEGQPNHKVIKDFVIRTVEFEKTTSAKIKRGN